MKVWITKYALTQGILEKEVVLCLDNGKETGMVKGDYSVYYHGEGKEWHRTRESAVRLANRAVGLKIASIRKQLKRLENLHFE